MTPRVLLVLLAVGCSDPGKAKIKSVTINDAPLPDQPQRVRIDAWCKGDDGRFEAQLVGPAGPIASAAGTRAGAAFIELTDIVATATSVEVTCFEGGASATAPIDIRALRASAK